jgi:hypothetical protein
MLHATLPCQTITSPAPSQLSLLQLDLGAEVILDSVTLFGPTLASNEPLPVDYGGGDLLVVRLSYTSSAGGPLYTGCGAAPGGVRGRNGRLMWRERYAWGCRERERPRAVPAPGAGDRV